MGANAVDRLYGHNHDEDESFVVTAGGSPSTVIVQAFGYSQEYKGVNRIVGDGGLGNDSITISDGVLVPANLSGGEGDDRLFASSAAATLSGGAGKDQLRGGMANDLLLGGG